MTTGPLRIAMISYYLPSGSKIGVGYQVDKIAREMVRRNHVVDVYSACPPVKHAPYGHHFVDLRGSLRTFRFATQLRGIDFGAYDVLHAHGDDYWMWKRRVPAHVRTLHGSCFEEAIRIQGVVEKARMVALGFSEILASIVADETVVVSPATRRWTPWVRGVIPNGVDLSHFRPDPSSRSDVPVILFVGGWHGRKRGALLAEIFHSCVRPRVPTAELWMVSQDAPNEVGPGIRVLGRLSDRELLHAYQHAWLFCLPSSYEGFGIPYVEAMASGLPVVATPNVGAKYVADDGRAAAVVDPKRLGVELVRLLNDAQARSDLAEAGLKRARDFSLSSIADRYERLYRSAAARHSI